MEKKQKSPVVMYIIFFIVFAAVAVIYGISEGSFIFGGKPQNINEMIEEHGEPQKGEYVTIGVDAVVGWYAETKYKINGFIPAGSKQHALVWLDNGAFMSMSFKGKKNIEIVDDIIDDTYSYLMYASDTLPQPVEFVGKITTIDSKVSQYYDEILDYWEISPVDGLEVYYLDIDTTNTKGFAIFMLVFFVFLAVVFLALAIKGIKDNKAAKLAAATSYVSSYQTTDTVSDDNIFGNMRNSDAYAPNTSSGDENNNLYQ